MFSADEVKKIWKSLAKKYHDEHHLVQMSKSGDSLEDVYVSDWPLYVHLQFLKLVRLNYNMTGNLDGLFAKRGDCSDGHSEFATEMARGRQNQLPIAPQSQQMDPELGSQTILQSDEDRNKRLLSEIRNFFESLLDHVVRIDPSETMMYRNAIQDIVLQYAYPAKYRRLMLDRRMNLKRKSRIDSGNYFDLVLILTAIILLFLLLIINFVSSSHSMRNINITDHSVEESLRMKMKRVSAEESGSFLYQQSDLPSSCLRRIDVIDLRED